MPEATIDKQEMIRTWQGREPGLLVAEEGNVQSAGMLLEACGYKAPKVISAKKAGEGNMNLTLRVGLEDGKTVILKQARPWVEKYPQVAAPADRAMSEAGFYELTGKLSGVNARMPRMLGKSQRHKALVFEDLGPSSDLTSVYKGHELSVDQAGALGSYLLSLHDGTRGMFAEKMANRDMRALNHAHMYDLPLRDPPLLELDALGRGLAAEAGRLRNDATYIRHIGELGKRYLSDGEVLLHGDFFPGSFLTTPGGLFVIDPEFCFFGFVEFDLGVCVAHMALGRQPVKLAERLLQVYQQQEAGVGKVDTALLSRVAGAEVMRRLIGLAQLPLAAELDKVALLQRSYRAVMEGKWTCLFQ